MLDIIGSLIVLKNNNMAISKHLFSKVVHYLQLFQQEVLIRPLLRKRPKYEKRYRISICGIFKNEGEFLKEWIEYNNMIGIDHFYLYNNNSDDNYAEALTRYINEGLVTLIDFPYDHAQMKAYQHFYETYRHETQWVSFLDIDEFFVPISRNNLNDWIKGYEKYPVIQIYWKMFGTSGLMTHDPNRLVIEQYHVSWKSIYDCGKCLINTDYDIVRYDTTTHHGPTVYFPFMGMKIKVKPVNIFRRSALGEGFYFRIGVDKQSPSIQINHYWSKAWDIYDEKRKRTDVYFKENPKAKIEYFLFHENQNCSSDYNIYKYLMQLRLKLNHID